MNSAIFIVFLKEVLENLRDRRTVLNTLVMGPLLGPLLFAGLISLITHREVEKAEKPLEIPVIGAEFAPNLINSLKQQGLKTKPAVDNPEQKIRDQDEEVVLRIPSTFPDSWNKGEIAQVELLYDSSRRDSSSTVARIRRMLEQYGQRTGTLRLLARGLSPSITIPIVIGERDLSTSQSRSALLFGMLPYFLIVTAFVGGMYLAIDTTAGERERQSLEPLLVNPVARWKIMAGKLMATFAFAMISLFLGLIAFSLSSYLIPSEKFGMALHLDSRFAAIALLVMAPLVLLASALQTLIAAFAKSYREAQTYLQLLMLVPMIPTLMLILLPLKSELWMMTVPLLSQHLIVTKLVRGEMIAGNEVALSVASGSVIALLVCVLAARIYRSERLAISS